MTSLQQTSDGGYILGGSSSSPASDNKGSTNYGGSDFWVVKTDAAGEKLWDRSFGGSADEYLYAIEQTGDGGYLLAGVSSSAASGNKTNSSLGVWLVRLDANGNKLWESSLAGSIPGFRQTSDGGFIVGTSIGQNIKIARLDANGGSIWEKSFGGSGTEYLGSVQQTSDGGYVVGAPSASPVSAEKTAPNYGDFDYWVLRLDTDGSGLSEYFWRQLSR